MGASADARLSRVAPSRGIKPDENHFEADPCADCGVHSLVRQGSLMVCDTCGAQHEAERKEREQ